LSEALMGSTLALLLAARSNRIDNQVLAIGKNRKASGVHQPWPPYPSRTLRRD
jgi:hypothetical protein